MCSSTWSTVLLATWSWSPTVAAGAVPRAASGLRRLPPKRSPTTAPFELSSGTGKLLEYTTLSMYNPYITCLDPSDYRENGNSQLDFENKLWQ